MIIKRELKEFNELNQPNKLIIVIILWNIIAAVLIGFANFPRALLYLTDLFNVILFLLVLKKQKGRGGRVKRANPLIWAIIFSFIAIASAMINLASPVLTIWGIRQNLRYIIFFYSCIEVMNEKCIVRIINIIKVVFWASLPLCFYEALFIEYSADTIVGDMVGGVFCRVGGNTPLNIILCLYICYVMLRCFEKKYSFFKLLLVLIAGVTMAVLAELKIFIVEIVIIAIYCAVVSKISWKTVALVILGILLLNTAIYFFVEVNARGRSYYTSELFSIESMIDYATRTSGYDGNGDLNRLTAVSGLINKFFDKDLVGLMIGYGIGSADYSKSSEMLTSVFYKNYSYLHYQYFSDSFIFIETGILGLVSYMMIFLSAIRNAIFKWKNNRWKKWYIMSVVLMIIMIVYNTTMRNEFCGYILFAILAIPYCRYLNTLRIKGDF